MISFSCSTTIFGSCENPHLHAYIQVMSRCAFRVAPAAMCMNTWGLRGPCLIFVDQPGWHQSRTVCVICDICTKYTIYANSANFPDWSHVCSLCFFHDCNHLNTGWCSVVMHGFQQRQQGVSVRTGRSYRLSRGYAKPPSHNRIITSLQTSPRIRSYGVATMSQLT